MLLSPPQITKNRAETSRYSTIPIPSSLKQPCIPIWSRVDDAEDIFFPSTKNSSCPSPPPPQKNFTLFNLYRTLLLYRIPFILVSYLTTTSYSSIRDPRDLLDKIPPLPTTMHRLQLRLEGRTARH